MNAVPSLSAFWKKFAVNGAESRWRRPHITVSRRKIREKAEEEIALARKVAMIAAKAGARPAAADYGMSQEQFASVMSGGYSASGNEGQPQYAGGQDGTACNAAQNADSSAAQYGAAGIAGQKWCDAG